MSWAGCAETHPVMPRDSSPTQPEAFPPGQGGNYRDILELCDKVITRWPDSDESLEARKLISRCYTQMAEHEAARLAFLTYADEAGERACQTQLGKSGMLIPAAPAGLRRGHRFKERGL